MYVNKGGTLYGFCPAKVLREQDTVQLFHVLLISAETGQMLYNGGIIDQPEWFIDLLGWFIPAYDQMKFGAKADMILGGDGTSASKIPNKVNPRRR